MRAACRGFARRAVVVLAIALLMEVAAAGSSNMSLRNGTVAGGGGVVSAGRFTVIWTTGEASMGTKSAGPFRLTSGFPATIGNQFQGFPGGAIFKDGFEEFPGGAP